MPSSPVDAARPRDGIWCADTGVWNRVWGAIASLPRGADVLPPDNIRRITRLARATAFTPGRWHIVGTASTR